MSELVQWWPLQWVIRILLLTTSSAVLIVVGLYFARFLRPAHVWKLLTAELPQFRNLEGTAKVLGQELTLKGEFLGKHEEQLKVLEQRVQVLERQLQRHMQSFELTLSMEDRDDPALAGSVEAAA